MRKVSALLLAAAALLGLNTAATTSQAMPAPAAVEAAPIQQARDIQPKVPVKLQAQQLHQLAVKDSVKHSHRSPKRRYHRQHWRRVCKGW